jgi:hypothetical protein
VKKLPSIGLQNHRKYFHLTRILVVAFDKSNKPATLLSKDFKEISYQPPKVLAFDSITQTIEFRVTVSFQTSVFGSFTQRILFNFGSEPLLMKEFNIDIGSQDTLKKLTDARQAVNPEALPWDDRDIKVIRCEPNAEKESLMSTYSLPKEAERIVSAQLVEGEIREDTYKQTMHQLLFTEEVHMRNLLLR